MDGLLSKPDRWRFWFGLLAVEPLVWSGPNNYGCRQLRLLLVVPSIGGGRDRRREARGRPHPPRRREKGREKGSSTTGGLDGDGGELPREREGGPTPHVHDMLDPVSVKTTQNRRTA
jgi:hypothetical protein